MSVYDMLIIAGLPRSGTTFLNNVFASGAISDKFYGQHSSHFGQLGTNPLHLCESRIIGISFMAGCRVEPFLKLYTSYWKYQIKDQNKTIVYKHPQLALQLPFENVPGWQTKCVLCMRDFEAWRMSFIKFQGHCGFTKDATDSFYEKYWPNEWQHPENIEQRISILYKLFIEKIEANKEGNFVFHYSRDPGKLMSEIARMIEFFDDNEDKGDVNKRARKIINRYWRQPI